MNEKDYISLYVPTTRIVAVRATTRRREGSCWEAFSSGAVRLLYVARRICLERPNDVFLGILFGPFGSRVGLPE
jgi:hypothetical protein